MKRTLIITPWFDPAFRAGGPVASLVNLIRQQEHQTDFYVVAGIKDVDGTLLDLPVKDEWVSYGSRSHVIYCSSASPVKMIRSQIRSLRPDVIFINGFFDFHYNILPMMLLSPKSSIVISVRGMLHPGALGQKRFKKRFFLTLLKTSGLTRNISFHATDEKEAAYIKNIFGKQTKIFVAPNFPRPTASLPVCKKNKGTIQLITPALISPMKNHDLVLKALRMSDADITYHIVGGIKDIAYWNRCREFISLLPEKVKVIYHGEQSPEAVPSFLSQAHLCIMPSKSENYGHAIVECLQAGLPVITSNHTPWNGLLEKKAGMNVDTTAEAIGQAITFFADMDDDQFAEYQKGAIAYSAAAVDTDKTALAYRKMWNLDN